MITLLILSTLFFAFLWIVQKINNLGIIFYLEKNKIPLDLEELKGCIDIVVKKLMHVK